MHQRTQWNTYQRQRIPRLDIGLFASQDLIPDTDPHRADDVAFLSIGIMQKSDTRAPVGIVFDSGHFGRDIELAPLEINQTVESLIAPPLALAAIQEAGLTTKDVVLTSIGYTQRAAIAQGSVDAVLGFSNNDLVQMQVAGLDVRAIPLKEDTPLVAAAMITTREWAQAHPEVTRALVQATSAGAALAVSDPEKALDSTATRDESLSDTNTRATAKAVLEAMIPLLKNSSDQVSPV